MSDDGLSADQARLLSTSENHAFGSWKNVFVMIWHGETTAEAVDEFERHLQTVASMHRRRLALVAIIEQTAPPPAAKLRKKLSQILGRAHDIHAAALAFEGSGFRAAIVRSVVVGMNMLTRLPFPNPIFASTEEATRWLSEQFESIEAGRIDAAALHEALASMRRRCREELGW